MTRLLGLNNVPLDIGLALIPVVISYAIIWLSMPDNFRAIRIAMASVLVVVWLVFLPNACYLITEWRHFFDIIDRNNLFIRAETDHMAFAYFLAMGLTYFLFSGFGLLTFALAIRPMEKLAAHRGATTWFWTLPFFTALSLGVYLGLVQRFNSWDPVFHPKQIWYSVVAIGAHPNLILLIFLFGIFLWLAYEAIDVWIDGLAERWSRITGRRVHLGPNWE